MFIKVKALWFSGSSSTKEGNWYIHINNCLLLLPFIILLMMDRELLASHNWDTPVAGGIFKSPVHCFHCLIVLSTVVLVFFLTITLRSCVACEQGPVALDVLYGL